MNFEGQDILSIRPFNRGDTACFEDGQKLEPYAHKKKLGNFERKVLVSLFYEPSTRTRLSFETAIPARGNVVTVVGQEFSSLSKGKRCRMTDGEQLR